MVKVLNSEKIDVNELKKLIKNLQNIGAVSQLLRNRLNSYLNFATAKMEDAIIFPSLEDLEELSGNLASFDVLQKRIRNRGKTVVKSIKSGY